MLTPQELYNDLSARISGSNKGLKIDAQFSIFSPDILSALNISELDLSSVVLESPTASQVIISSAQVNVLSVDQTVDITFTINSETGDINQLWKFSPLSAWNFKDSFPGLPGYYGADPDEVGFVSKANFLYDFTFQAPQFIYSTLDDPDNNIYKGLNFTGSLLLSGQQLLSDIELAVLGQGPLETCGTIGLSTAGNQIYLETSGSPSLTIGSFNIGAVGLAMAVKGDNTWQGSSRMFLVGSVKVDNIDVFISTLLLEGNNLWTLEAAFQKGQLSLKNGFDQVAGILGINSSEITLPAGIEQLSSFYLSSLTFGFDPQSRSLSFITTVIDSEDSWAIPLSDITVDQIRISLTYPTGGSLFGYVSGLFQFGNVSDSPTFEGQVSLPDLSVEIGLEEGKSIDFKPWIENKLGLLFQGDLTCTSLTFWGDLPEKQYSFYGVFSSTITVSLGGNDIEFNSLGVGLNIGNTNQINVEADFLLGGQTFEGSFLSKGSNYTVAATLGRPQSNPYAIHIGSWISALVKNIGINDFSGEIPNIIDSITLSWITFSYDSHTKNFTFSCDTQLTLETTPLDLLLNIQLTHNQDSYEKSFEGKLTIGENVFDVEFDKVTGKETSSLLLGSYSDPDGKGINVSDLAGDLGVEVGSLGGLTINDIVIARESAPAKGRQAEASSSNQKATFLTASFKGGFDLTNLPVVGRYFSGSEKVQFSVQPVLIRGSISGDATSQIQTYVTGLGLSYPRDAKGSELVAILTIGGQAIPLDYQFQPDGKGGVKKEDGPQQSLTVADPPKPDSVPIIDGNIQWYKLQKSFGPVHLEKVGLNFSDKTLEFLLDASLSGAGLTLSLIDLGISSSITDFSPSFSLDGIGIDYQNSDGSVTIGGLLLKNKDDYEGMALIETDALSLSAIGGYTTIKNQTVDHPSLFLFAVLDKPLGGPTFFFVNGLAAGFGFNRNLVIPAIDRVSAFPLVSLAMGNTQKPASLNDAMGLLAGWITPQVGEEFFALGVHFSTFKMIESFALLTVRLGRDFEIDVLGLSTMTVPTPDPDASENSPSPLAEVQMAVKAAFIPSQGFLGVQAQLTSNSFIFSRDCHLTGGFALYAWFDNAPADRAGQFVVTLGGYYPGYTVPDYYPQVPKLGFHWQVDTNLSLSGGVYYAMVPHAMMAGGAMAAVYEDGNFRAWFDAAIDLLMAWKPYHYEGGASVDIGASYRASFLGVHHTFTVHVGAYLSIRGPDFSGTATIEICDIHFHITFGDDNSTPKPLDWGEFQQSFLPDTDRIISCKPVRGLLNDGTSSGSSDWILDPDEFCFEITTAIPAKGSDRFLGSQNKFGIAPMDCAEDQFQSFIQIDAPDDLRFEPIFKNVPTGLWGETMKPGVNDPAFIESALCGFTVSQSYDLPDKTPALPKSELEYNTTGPEIFRWAAPVNAPIWDNSADNSTIVTGLNTVNSDRQAILNELGMAGTFVMHNPEQLVNEFYVTPQVFHLS